VAARGEPSRQARDPASKFAIAPGMEAVADRQSLRLAASNIEQMG
jgi:hypothetical protein